MSSLGTYCSQCPNFPDTIGKFRHLINSLCHLSDYLLLFFLRPSIKLSIPLTYSLFPGWVLGLSEWLWMLLTHPYSVYVGFTQSQGDGPGSSLQLVSKYYCNTCMCRIEQPKQEKKWKNLQFISQKLAGLQVHSERAIIKHMHICWHFHNYIWNSHILGLAALRL